MQVLYVASVKEPVVIGPWRRIGRCTKARPAWRRTHGTQRSPLPPVSPLTSLQRHS